MFAARHYDTLLPQSGVNLHEAASPKRNEMRTSLSLHLSISTGAVIASRLNISPSVPKQGQIDL